MGLQKIGAVWRNTKGDLKYFNGNMEVIVGIPMKILLMPYESKDGKLNPKAPAYNVFISTPDDENDKTKAKPKESLNQAEID